MRASSSGVVEDLLVDDRAALVGLPHPTVRRGDRRVDEDLAREVPGAVEAEVHAQPHVALGLEEHLLADGLHAHGGPAVENRGPSANRPCGLEAESVFPMKLRSNWRAIRWTE